jgi:hypothetical protein
MMLSKTSIEDVHEWKVESVHPYRGRVAGISVIVIRPRRRQDEIARLHRRSFTFNGGVGAGAFDHETQGRCGMPMVGATSPGKMSCKPAYKLSVICEEPRIPGFSNMRTRRSADLAVMSFPDSIRNGRISLRQIEELAGRVSGTVPQRLPNGAIFSFSAAGRTRGTLL